LAAHIRERAGRRRQPRLIDTDLLILKGMASAIRELAASVANPGAVVVDFGCGSRPYEPIFRAHGMTYLGADFADADILIDPKGHIDLPDTSCDVVLSIQVLEHVRDLDRYFAEARRILRPGGKLLLSTHGTWLFHPHPEDHRRWTMPGLVEEIRRQGFENTNCIPVVGPLAWTTIVRLTLAVAALRRVPLVGPPAARALACMMNLRAALEDAITPAWVTRDNACVYVTLSGLSPHSSQNNAQRQRVVS
jgi:SAM-dependent methyltransferase